MRIEDEAKYVVDLRQTIYANIFYIPLLIVIYLFLVLLINIIGTIDTADSVNRLLAVIIVCFTGIKMIYGIRKPHIHFKYRE